MTEAPQTPAQWLIEQFEVTDPTYIEVYDEDEGQWARPAYMQPLFILKSVMDAGYPMHVAQGRLPRRRAVVAMTGEPPFDPYKILGIDRDATGKQVKAAYRKLAKKHHPDTNPGDTEAAARFRDITDACNILTDPARRKEWDQAHPPAPGSTVASGQALAASRILAVLEDTWTSDPPPAS